MPFSKFKLIIPVFFFLSGFAGLVYEIVWTRQLLLIFGSTTHSVVAVLSAFMGGLALGSFFIGRIADRIHNLLKFYGILELIVGTSALGTLILFPLIQITYQWLFLALDVNQYLLLLLKFILTFIALLPATIAMGGTLPVLVRFLVSFSPHISKATSYLYAVNTFGAVFGVIITGFILIELLGLRMSLLLAVFINFGIGSISWMVGHRIESFIINVQNQTKKLLKVTRFEIPRYGLTVALIAFGFSGLVSLAYEVLWTRLLTPSVGTYIYAFSGILGVYLFGIATGSLLYRFAVDRLGHPLLVFGVIELGIGISAVFSVLANSSLITLSVPLKVLVTIFPATLLMGMSFPVVMKLFQGQESVGKSIGIVYSANTFGTIIGSIAAAFLLIPLLGTVKSILVLSLVNFVLSIALVFYEGKVQVLIKSFVIALGGFAIVWTGNLLSQSSLALQEAKVKARIESLKGLYEVSFLEDEVASVLGYRQVGGGDSALIIDGVQTTSLGPETTLLAHLPIFLHKNPSDMLVIAFGMGSTFRSALLHDNLLVDAVDLVPSVPKMFPLFYDDAQSVLNNPRGEIIVNDGRNFVKMTNKKYDIIVVDPPPPVNAAGTTVLYSKEFYEDSKERLKPGGIFVAWLYTGARLDDFQMLLKSFYEVFPHILVLRSPQGWGYYVFGSEEKLVWDSEVMEEKYLQSKFFQDINRTRLNPTFKSKWEALPFGEINRGLLGDESFVRDFIKDAPPITDDRPRTEYFLIRQKKEFQPMADLEEWQKQRK